MAIVMGADRILERIEALWDELNELEDRLAARFGGPPETTARLLALEQAVRDLGARQEEILAGTDRLLRRQVTYLDDDVALTTLESGERIYADRRDGGIATHLLTAGMWDPAHLSLFRRLLRAGDRVLDIGANHGVYALAAAAAVGPSGEVHAYEPNPRLAALARRSALINGAAGWLHVHEAAVADEAGTGVLAFDGSWSAAGNIRKGRPEAAGLPVPVLALDEVFTDPNLIVHAIKLDIEGGEGLALHGMRRLLERSPEVRILVNFAPSKLADAGTPAEEVAAMLAGLGLTPSEITTEGRPSPGTWDELLAAPGRMGKILVARGEVLAL
ncbi:FkbM family methyltransferase [Roseomonas sp. CCTCC AB2023176]|uniref:FkbM family methyltransferase n=1 Tax=Roseomonas sp. CCTCC AB2023176 TaxID=3342640 RepID=UPI0035D794ED